MAARCVPRSSAYTHAEGVSYTCTHTTGALAPATPATRFRACEGRTKQREPEALHTRATGGICTTLPVPQPPHHSSEHLITKDGHTGALSCTMRCSTSRCNRRTGLCLPQRGCVPRSSARRVSTRRSSAASLSHAAEASRSFAARCWPLWSSCRHQPGMSMCRTCSHGMHATALFSSCTSAPL
jgi:hypothetical protein